MGQVGWEDHNHTAPLQFPLCAWKGRKKSPQTTMELDSVLPESGKSKVWRLKEPLPSGARLRPPSRREQSCWQQMRLQPYLSPLSSCCAAQAGFVLMFLALCSFLIQVAVFIASFSPMHWFCLLLFSPSSHHYSSFVSGQKSKKVHLSSDISVSAFFSPFCLLSVNPRGNSPAICSMHGTDSERKQHFFSWAVWVLRKLKWSEITPLLRKPKGKNIPSEWRKEWIQGPGGYIHYRKKLVAVSLVSLIQPW